MGTHSNRNNFEHGYGGHCSVSVSMLYISLPFISKIIFKPELQPFIHIPPQQNTSFTSKLAFCVASCIHPSMHPSFITPTIQPSIHLPPPKIATLTSKTIFVVPSGVNPSICPFNRPSIATHPPTTPKQTQPLHRSVDASIHRSNHPSIWIEVTKNKKETYQPEVCLIGRIQPSLQ